MALNSKKRVTPPVKVKGRNDDFLERMLLNFDKKEVARYIKNKAIIGIVIGLGKPILTQFGQLILDSIKNNYITIEKVDEEEYVDSIISYMLSCPTKHISSCVHGRDSWMYENDLGKKVKSLNEKGKEFLDKITKTNKKNTYVGCSKEKVVLIEQNKCTNELDKQKDRDVEVYETKNGIRFAPYRSVTLAEGTYFIPTIYKGNRHLIIVRIDKYNEKCDIVVFGVNHKDLYNEITDYDVLWEYENNKAKKSIEEKEEKVKAINIINGDYDVMTINVKTLGGIIFNERDNILNRIEAWKNMNETNSRYGISNSLGILLTGGFGTGKTSFVYSLAGHYNVNIENVDTSLPLVEVEARIKALAKKYQSKDGNKRAIRGIILLDEIDRVLPMNDRKAEEFNEDKVRIATLLNQMMGGSKSLSNVIIVGTTNKSVENFPQDLVRKGRLGNIYHMNDIDRSLIKDMCAWFDEDIVEVEAWYGSELPLNPTECQNVIINFKQEKI